MTINYDQLPQHIRGSMRRYIESGIEPGGFLMAVLCNDLMGAMGKADDVNRERLWDICGFLYNEAPATCFGSIEAFLSWVDRGGMEGRRK